MRKEGATAEALPPSGAGRAGARGYRPLPLRERLYERVLELRNEGLSYRQIIRKVEEEFGERLSKSHVSLWVRGLRKPTGKVRHELEVCPELAWLLGALLGDGKKKLRHGEKGYYTFEVEAKPELVEEFARAVPEVVELTGTRRASGLRGADWSARASVQFGFIVCSATSASSRRSSSHRLG